jgi:hypothetical protein
MRRDPRQALAGALICLVGLVLTGLAALAWPNASTRDAEALQGFQSLNRGPVTDAASRIVHVGEHELAALTLALLAVVVAPARWRAIVAAVGTVFAGAVAGSILVLAWHFPSDVVGGFLVAALWTLLAVAALFAAERRWPAGARRASARAAQPLVWPLEAVGVALGSAGVAVALARPGQVADFAADHTAAVAGGALIAGVAVALAGGVLRALRG